MTDNNYSIAVFPFLKTHNDVSIGGLTFRSTERTDGLTPCQANSVADVSRMLFLQNDLHIKSASYAVVPIVDPLRRFPDIEHLSNVQAVVAYLYASPHEIFGDVFLTSEHASLALFTPGQVPFSLVRPDFHVSAVDGGSDLSPDKRGMVPGFSGLYNFRHPFWAARGSRIYGPQPHLTLNHAQDLSNDVWSATSGRPDYAYLFQRLLSPPTAASSRIFTAVQWFNAANRESNADDVAIVNLSIAFESLLSLPKGEKTERLVDTISLLLGRIARLDVWARQFYDTRSRVVHEGYSRQLHFVATDSTSATNGSTYQPLLSYGRQVFQLCLATLLVGSNLAERARLEERLVTNEERFEKICIVLANKNLEPRRRLSDVYALVEGLERYRFLGESGLTLERMIGAARLAAETLLACDGTQPDVREALRAFSAAKRTNDHIEELEALSVLEPLFAEHATPTETDYDGIVGKLVRVVWGYVFMHYHWIKERRSAEA
jgi:hypothetical protein